MIHYQTKDSTIPLSAKKSLASTIYSPLKQPAKAIIIYLHGGGMIFGSRKDLPEAYIRMLTEAGYQLISIDYPLAPEAPLSEILHETTQAVTWLCKEHTEPIFIMGRSAGAYLALSQALKHPQIKGLIFFYGYYNLADIQMNRPSSFYSKFNPADRKIAMDKRAPGVIYEASLEERFPLYVYARQSGTWISMIVGPQDPPSMYSYNVMDLRKLPATFIASSKEDPDVPSQQSISLHAMVPQSELHLIDGSEHDFDRTQLETTGLDTYRKLIVWLDNLVS